MQAFVVDVAEDVAGLGHSAHLLEGQLQGVLPLHRLESGDDERGCGQPVLERGGEPVEIVPVAGDELAAHRLAEQGVERAVVAGLAGPVERLVGEVAQPGAKRLPRIVHSPNTKSVKPSACGRAAMSLRRAGCLFLIAKPPSRTFDGA
jgi:hypothetical protein